MKIVVAAMSGIVGTVILMTIGFFGYKKYKNRQIERQSEVLRIHGNHGNFRHR
jgi:predicted DNA-binding protein with PD1-like motif